MNPIDSVYRVLLRSVVTRGEVIPSRNSETKRVMNVMQTFETAPLISVRKVAWRNALREMEWFLSGSSNIHDLDTKVHHWWKPWADNNGDIPNGYSKQFRRFENRENTVDQIQYLLNELRANPYSRRSVISTWNTADMLAAETPITNCHGSIIQVFVNTNNSLHLTMYQRSADMVVGVPHNWIQYWALLLWLAAQSDKSVGTFTWVGGDCHIYSEHYGLVSSIIQTVTSEVRTPELLYTGKVGDTFKAEDFILDIPYSPIILESAAIIL